MYTYRPPHIWQDVPKECFQNIERMLCAVEWFDIDEPTEKSKSSETFVFKVYQALDMR